jgi:hypothetical protein
MESDEQNQQSVWKWLIPGCIVAGALLKILAPQVKELQKRQASSQRSEEAVAPQPPLLRDSPFLNDKRRPLYGERNRQAQEDAEFDRKFKEAVKRHKLDN